MLEHLGAHVDYHDPLVPQTFKMRHLDLHMKSVGWSKEIVASYDCVLIATNHSTYDWQMIADNAKLIVDTRNALSKVTGKRDHIVKA
jgi:UDP-N-acetyl-D-glucosamine dehydrogenase